jgi:hypothetical protein
MVKCWKHLAATGICLLLTTAHCSAEGAFATGTDHRGRHWAGWTFNRSTVQSARSGAMEGCQQRGPGCSIVATFRNACFVAVYGTTRGRSGYGWATRGTTVDAQNAALSSCRSSGMISCEVKASVCDTVDEAAISAQRRMAQEQAAEDARRQRIAEEQAAEDARRQRIAAEQAARDAEQKARQAQNTYRPQDPPTRSAAPIQNDDPSAGISNKKALGIAIFALLAICVVILRQGYPKLAGFTGLIMPIASFVIYFSTGIEVKDHVTMYELPLFAPLFGGALVAALVYKLHA